MRKIIIQTGQTKKNTGEGLGEILCLPQRSQCSGIWEDKHWHIFVADMGRIMMQRRKKCAVIPYASPPTVNRALRWHIITGSKL